MRPLVEQPVVLAIGAHPGYVERLCAGTLALLHGRGWRVALASMTGGNGGADTFEMDAAACPRRQEAHRSAAVLEGSYTCLDVADYAITYGDELCRRTTALIRDVRPAVVLTHGPETSAPDCEETSRILRQACVTASARGYVVRGAPCDGRVAVAGAGEPGSPGEMEPTGRVPHLYYLDPPELTDAVGHPVEPTLVVDVAETIECKAKMLAQFGEDALGRSGRTATTEGLDEAYAWAQKRGADVGARYAEGFRQHVGPGYPRDDLLKQVLGALAHPIADNSG